MVIQLEDASDVGFAYSVNFTCRSPGVTAGIVTASSASYKADGNTRLHGDNESTVGTINTTIAQYLDVTASFNANGNSLRWDSLVIDRRCVV